MPLAGHAAALAGAWIEQPAPRRSPSPAQPLAAPAAPRPATIAAVAPGAPVAPRPAPMPPTAPAANTAPRPRPLAAPGLDRTVALVAGALRSASPPAATAPSRDLHVEHLDVRIITEPAPAPARPAVAGRMAATSGAWRPSARRFLRKP